MDHQKMKEIKKGWFCLRKLTIIDLNLKQMKDIIAPFYRMDDKQFKNILWFWIRHGYRDKNYQRV